MKTLQLLTMALIVLLIILSLDSTHAQSQDSTMKCLENIDYWHSENYLEEVFKCFTQKSISRMHNVYDYDVIERFLQKYRRSRVSIETYKALMNAELNRLEGKTVPNRKLDYIIINIKSIQIPIVYKYSI